MVTLRLYAGDPVPDVDVILEQIPVRPPRLLLEISNGAPFDRLTLGGSRGFLADLAPERLPPGWVMTREGKRVVLAGPAVTRPTRFALRTGRTVDRGVDWEVSLAGRELANRRQVVPRAVAPTPVRNSLQGVVVMPEKVSPGEAIALRALPEAALPPGRFVLSGVVMEPLADDDPSSLLAVIDTTRRHLETPMLTAPRDDFVLEAPAGTPCGGLLPLAAALVAGDATGDCAGCRSLLRRPPDGSAHPAGARVLGPGPVDPAGHRPAWVTAELRRSAASPSGAPAGLITGHDTAKTAIRNIKALYAVAAPGGTDEEPGSDAGPRRAGRWEILPPGGATFALEVQERVRARPEQWVALAITEDAGGCRVVPREPDLFDLAIAMQVQKPPHDRPAGKPDRDRAAARVPEESGSGLQVGLVPEDASPGVRLALQYVDRFGDLVVDVPVVDDTEVVPAADEPWPPCVTTATAFAQAGDAVCVCGHFPGAAAQAGLRVDEREAGLPLSSSARTMQFRLPAHASTPGRHLWSGASEAGYAPGCRAWMEVVEIGGAIDSQRLFSSESTPMRLSVSGTTARVPLRIRNLTPAIVRVEGGDDQTVESSGGTPNLATRSVQGLQRGDFRIEWSLATERCPCP